MRKSLILFSLACLIIMCSPAIKGQNWENVNKIKLALDDFQWTSAKRMLEQDSSQLCKSEKGAAIFNSLKGNIFMNQNKAVEATPYISKAIEYFRQHDDADGEVDLSVRLLCYTDWADCNKDNGEQQALACVLEAISYYEKHNQTHNRDYIALLKSLVEVSPDAYHIQQVRSKLINISNEISNDDHRLWGYIYLCQATMAMMQGNMTAVQENYDKCLDHFKKSPNQEREPGYILLLTNISSFYYSVHRDYPKSKTYFMESYRLLHEFVPAIGAELAWSFAQAIITDGLVDDAITFAQNARDDYLALHDFQQADAIGNQIDSWKKLMKTTRFNNHEEFSVQDIISRGVSAHEAGNYDLAIHAYNQALQMLESQQNKEKDSLVVYANVCELLANVYMYTGNLPEAETVLSKGLQVIKKTDENSSIYRHLLFYLANYYSTILDATHAFETYNELKYQFEKNLDFSSDYYTCLNNLAKLSGQTKDYVNEYQFSQQVINHYTTQSRTLNDDYDLMQAYRSASQSAAFLGNHDLALDYIEQARGLAEGHVEFQGHLPSIYHSIGVIDLALNKSASEKAVEYFRKSFQQANDIESGEALGAIEYSRGNDRHCRETIGRVTSLIKENVLTLFSFLPSAERETYWLTMQVNLVRDNSLLIHSGRKDDQSLRSIYDNLLFSKGLLLKTSNFISNEIQRSGDAESNQLYHLVQGLYSVLDNNQLTGDSIRHIKAEINSIEKKLALKFASIDNLKASLSKSWKDVQQQLADGEAAIEFALMPTLKRSMPFLVDSMGIDNDYYAFILERRAKAPTAVRLCSDRELQQLLEQQGQKTEDWISSIYSHSNESPVKGETLYRHLWQAIDSILVNHHISVVYYSPYGGLNSVSFPAIHDGKNYLADKYELHQVSTTGDIGAIKSNQQSGVKTATIYGSILYDAPKQQLVAESKRYTKPTMGSEESFSSSPQDLLAMTASTRGRGNIGGLEAEWLYLKGTRTEADMLTKCMRQRHIDVQLLDSIRANEESLKSLSGKSRQIIHIATHGFYIPSDEDELKSIFFMNQNNVRRRQQAINNPMLRSGLVFAGANRAWTGEGIVEGIEDGIATAEEISQLDLRGTHLVTLSACQSGLGDVQSAEGVFGLQRAFKMAGVESLIVSLWSVDDATTSEFMEMFYTYWLDGNSRQQAFKKTQIEMKRKYNNPFYWAAFVMID